MLLVSLHGCRRRTRHKLNLEASDFKVVESTRIIMPASARTRVVINIVIKNFAGGEWHIKERTKDRTSVIHTAIRALSV